MKSRCFTYLRNALLALTLLLCLSQAHPAQAQSNGYLPQASLVTGPDGCLYGTAPFGGDFGYEDSGAGYGTIYKISPSGVFTNLYSFHQWDGAYPYGGLALGPDGNFYGTTGVGGAYGVGALYKITPSGVFTCLHSFGWVEGAEPIGGVTCDHDGNIYGVATLGGTYNRGTVFKYAPDGTMTVLHSFDGNDGLYPETRLKLEKGVLYGTTLFGGRGATVDRYAYGTIFKITTDGQFTNLYTFNGTDGAYPFCSLTQGKDGNFYGNTENGGTDNRGIVFKITPDGVLTTLHSFTISEGWYPEG